MKIGILSDIHELSWINHTSYDLKINYLYITSFLKELEKKHSLSFKCDGHWNGKTHQDLATYLYRELF